jgi:chloride channel 7
MLVKENVALGWLNFTAFSLLYGFIAVSMTVYIGPGAAGGGTAELMGYFNGINYPDFIKKRTLIVKILALSFAVSSGLCIGKEGPLAHIGAIVGPLCVYLPFKFMDSYRNDDDKREIAAAGVAAGVSAAFGSPIGGSLFAYEIARPNTFWSFGLMWKIFFSSSVATFLLNIFISLKMNNSLLVINAGLIKFGNYHKDPFKV